MTPQEITAWARVANITKECSGKRVRIKRDDGKCLTRSRIDGDIEWTDNLNLAYVYDYDADDVAGQLNQVEDMYKAKWTAEPIN